LQIGGLELVEKVFIFQREFTQRPVPLKLKAVEYIQYGEEYFISVKRNSQWYIGGVR
jgi:hypothetical protein